MYEVRFGKFQERACENQKAIHDLILGDLPFKIILLCTREVSSAFLYQSLNIPLCHFMLVLWQ